MQPKISIAIVTWNTLDLVKKCLESVDREGDIPYELFVTDNGSNDNTAEFLNNYKPANQNCLRYECTLNGQDFGYSIGVNQGIRKAKGEYVLLLNPDTEILPQTLSNLFSIAEKYPRMGIMAARLVFPHGGTQHCVSKLPSIANIIIGRLKLNKIFPNNKFIKRNNEVKVAEGTESVVPNIRGAVSLIKSSAIKKVGIFDEGYFLWFDETDYCKRLQDAGFDVMYTPNVNVIHQSEAAIGTMNIWERLFIYNKSLRRYFRKHHGLFYSLLAGIIDPVCMAIAMLIYRK